MDLSHLTWYCFIYCCLISFLTFLSKFLRSSLFSDSAASYSSPLWSSVFSIIWLPSCRGSSLWYASCSTLSFFSEEWELELGIASDFISWSMTESYWWMDASLMITSEVRLMAPSLPCAMPWCWTMLSILWFLIIFWLPLTYSMLDCLRPMPGKCWADA